MSILWGAIMLLSLRTVAQPLSCYVQARDTTFLSDQQALALCCRMDNTGPVDCFNEARLQRSLTSDQAMRLCTCAFDTGPVTCLNTARDETLLNKDAAINQCIGKSQYSFMPGGVPIMLAAPGTVAPGSPATTTPVAPP
jgi:hypothetical protein